MLRERRKKRPVRNRGDPEILHIYVDSRCVSQSFPFIFYACPPQRDKRNSF